MNNDVKQMMGRVEGIIEGYGRMLTAYSGGVDSTVVAGLARRVLGKVDAPAVVVDSVLMSRWELKEAREIAELLDIELIEVVVDMSGDVDFRMNEANRCYVCKGHIYERLFEAARELGVSIVASGTNADDGGDYRPGLVAEREMGVVSPLVEAGVSKAGVRALARCMGLVNAERPSGACLATRIPYGVEVTDERLSMIERAEDVLRGLGFVGCRVRHHETVARLEVGLEQMTKMMEDDVREVVVRRLNEIGYSYVSLDLAGFRSGSGNVVLDDDG